MIKLWINEQNDGPHRYLLQPSWVAQLKSSWSVYTYIHISNICNDKILYTKGMKLCFLSPSLFLNVSAVSYCITTVTIIHYSQSLWNVQLKLNETDDCCMLNCQVPCNKWAVNYVVKVIVKACCTHKHSNDQWWQWVSQQQHEVTLSSHLNSTGSNVEVVVVKSRDLIGLNL